jgi:hypothetical protein
VLQFEGASGLWKNKTLATGLTVGTTSISSGTDGRVLFQNGGVLQQSSALSFASGTFKLISNGGTQTLLVRNSADTFDIFSTGNSGANVHGFFNINDGANYMQISAGGRWVKMTHDYGQLQFTNSLGNNTFTLGNNGVSSFSGNVNIGGGTNGARLDVKAQGALSTDLALRVRNSANTKDVFAVRGDDYSIFGGNIFVNTGANASIIELYSAFSGATELTLQSSSGDAIINGRINLNFRLGGTQQMKFYSSTNLMIGQNLADSGYKLHVAGNFRCAPRGSLSTDIALLVRNFANTSDILSIAGNGNLSYNAQGGGITLLNNDGTTSIGSSGGSVTRVNLLGGPTTSISLNVAGTTGTIFNSTRGGASGETAFLFNASIGNLAGTTNYGKIINIKDGRTDLGNRANTVVGLLIQRDSANTNTLLNVQALSTITGNVGFGVLINNASAKVQIDSTTQGFLPPRMTNAERTAIASPAVGLMVYCTDAVEGLYIYKSMGWTFVI